MDALAAHQLLGRLVYFHVLFIEPAVRRAALPPAGVPQTVCCHHGPAGPPAGGATVGRRLRPSAWAAVEDATDHRRGCTSPQADDCCAVCHLGTCVRSLAATWLAAEADAYPTPALPAMIASVWIATAARQMAQVFAVQHTTPCRWLTATATSPTTALLAIGEVGARFPLTAELLALWADPDGSGSAPVTSWLNHCTDITDIGRLVTARSHP